MSQNEEFDQTFLQKIKEWTSQEYRTALDDVLPKLLGNVSSEKPTDIQLQTLHVICETLLRNCHAFQSLEDQLFAKLLPRIESLFESSLITVHEEDQQVIATNLQTLVVILECLVSMVENLRSFRELTLDMAYSVPNFVLGILRKSFLHCTQSKEIYGEMLETFGDHLNRFYQTTCKLQAKVIGLLDGVVVCEAAERDVRVLVQICGGIFELCQVVQTLDLKVMVELWRIYTKLLMRYQETLKQRLDVALVLRHLCQEVKTSAQSIRLVQPHGISEGKEAKKALKLCSFNMKLIVTFCDKFSGHLGNCICEIRDLMLFLLQLSAPTSGLQNSEDIEEVRQNLTIGIEPLTLYLLNEREFVSCLSVNAEFPYAMCLLHMIALDKLPDQEKETFEMWMKSSILGTIFENFSLCSLENLLPPHLSSVMCNGKPQRQVTLYEHVCTHLCAFVASLPSMHFYQLEEELLRSVLSRDWLRACLASDVWCFLARFSTSELCFSHCCLLAKLLGSLESWQSLTVSGLHAKALLKRLVRFLSPLHVASFAERFSTNRALGCFSTRPSDYRFCLAELFDGNLDQSSCQKLFNHLEGFVTQLKIEENKSFLPSSETAEYLVHLCSTLPEFCHNRSTLGNKLMHLSFEAAALSSKYMKPENLLQILCILMDESIQDSDLWHLVSIIFVRPLSDRCIPQSTLQDAILSKLADVLARILSRKNHVPVLREISLQTFAEFARQTPHEVLLPRVFRECGPLAQPEITRYLEKKIPKGPLQNFELVALLAEMAKKDTVQDDLQGKETHPPKRQKLCDPSRLIEVSKSSSEECRVFDDALIMLEKAIGQLQKLSQENPCPVDVQRRIEKNSQILQSFGFSQK